MSKQAKGKTVGGWTTPRRVVQYALLVVGILVFLAATYLMWLAGEPKLDKDRADQYMELSIALVGLVPSLFVGVFLAMGSQLPGGQRWVVRGAAAVFAGFFLLQLAGLGPELGLSAILGAASIFIAFVVDMATPNSVVLTKADVDLPKKEVEAKTDEVERSEGASPRGTPSRALQVGDVLPIVVLPIVAIILDVFAVHSQRRKVRRDQ